VRVRGYRDSERLFEARWPPLLEVDTQPSKGETMKGYFLPLVKARTQPKKLGFHHASRQVLAFGVAILAPLIVAMLLISARAPAQAQMAGAAPSTNTGAAGNDAVGNMSDVMVSMVYPAANNILLSIYRGGPQDDREWVVIQRNAVLLAESGNVLARRGPRGEVDWAKDAKMLADVGAAAYQAARSKDANALDALDQPLNAACTACHKQYRPNIAGAREREGPSRQTE
jgi:hypothetical protein